MAYTCRPLSLEGLGALGLPAAGPWAAEVHRGGCAERTTNTAVAEAAAEHTEGAYAPGRRKEARKSIQLTPSPDAWFLVDHYGRPRRTAPGHQERGAHVPGTLSSNHLLMLETGGATLRGAVTRPRLSMQAIAPPSVPLKAVRRPGDQLVQCHAHSRFQEPNLALLWPMACHHMGLISHPRLLDAAPPAWPYARATLAVEPGGRATPLGGTPLLILSPGPEITSPREEDHVLFSRQTRGPGRATGLTRRRAGWALQLPTGACHLGSEARLRLRASVLFLFIGLRQGGGAGGGKAKREYKKGVAGGSRCPAARICSPTATVLFHRASVCTRNSYFTPLPSLRPAPLLSFSPPLVSFAPPPLSLSPVPLRCSPPL